MNSMKLKNIERKIKDFSDTLINFEDQFVIIPFQPSGYIDYSNNGIVTGQYDTTQFETYKRLWTGNDAFIVTWKGSCTFDYSNQQNDLPTTNEINIKYQVGEHFLGYIEGCDIDNNIDTDTSFSEYKSQKNINSITFRINAAKFQLNDNYAYYFYKIPEISNQVLYRVVSLNKEYIGRDLVCYVLSLESLQDTLANTGKAKQQNVMPNAPGQGYISPMVKDISILEEWPQYIEGKDYSICIDKKRVVMCDYSRRMNNPVRYVVLKLFGLGILSFFSMIGRKVLLGNSYNIYGVPRLIFMKNFEPPSTYTLYRSQAEEVDFYFGVNIYPEINFSADAFERLKGLLNFYKYWDSQGILKINKKNTLNTNIENNGSYQYQIYGTQNEKNEWLPWTLYFPPGTKNTSYSYGCAQTYKIGGQKLIHDHMFDNFWTQKHIKVLPLTSSNTLNWGWTMGSATSLFMQGTRFGFIAGVLLLAIGLIATAVTAGNIPKYEGINGLIPASLYKFMAEEAAYTLQEGNYTRLNYFMNTDSNSNNSSDTGAFMAFFQVNTLNTSIQAELTDLIAGPKGEVFETLNIGQTENAIGEPLYADNSPLLMNGEFILQSIESDNEGFIIDSFNLQAVFKGDFSVEFLDKNKQLVWSGIYQSEAKWTDTIREINTWKDTSIFGREDIYVGKQLSYPKAIAELNPLTADNQLSIATAPAYQWSTVNTIQQGTASTVSNTRYYGGNDFTISIYYNYNFETPLTFNSLYENITSSTPSTLSNMWTMKNTIGNMSNYLIDTGWEVNSLYSFLSLFKKITFTVKYGMSYTVQESYIEPNLSQDYELDLDINKVISDTETDWFPVTFTTGTNYQDFYTDTTPTYPCNINLGFIGTFTNMPKTKPCWLAVIDYDNPDHVNKSMPAGVAKYFQNAAYFKLGDYQYKMNGTVSLRFVISNNRVYIEVKTDHLIELYAETTQDYKDLCVLMVTNPEWVHSYCFLGGSLNQGYIAQKVGIDPGECMKTNTQMQILVTNITMLKG